MTPFRARRSGVRLIWFNWVGLVWCFLGYLDFDGAVRCVLIEDVGGRPEKFHFFLRIIIGLRYGRLEYVVRS